MDASDITIASKRQPWKAYQDQYHKANRSKQITYNYIKGQTMLDNPGTAGELNISIEYDTGSLGAR